MRNPNMKVWMWQRLWKWYGCDEVMECVEYLENPLVYVPLPRCGWYWLDPKPCLVLVDQRRLDD